jgi:thioredoxin reductase (NADPH)
VIIIGGGIAGLSAAIYLGTRNATRWSIDSGDSMAKWAPRVENYLGFSKGVGGEELLKFGRQQAERRGVRFAKDETRACRQKSRLRV